MREHLYGDLMEKNVIVYKKRRALLIRWAYLVAFMAFFVVMFVGASLRHYGQAKTNVDRIYACTYEIHQHTENCFSESGETICGYADYCLHRHNDDCYDDTGELICILEEISEHEHTDNCYEEVRTLICELDDEAIETIEEIEQEVSSDNSANDEVKESEIEEDTEDTKDEDSQVEEILEDDDEVKDSEESTSENEQDEANDLEDEPDDEVLSEEQASTEENPETLEEINEEDTLSGSAGDEETSEEEDETESEIKVHTHTDDCYKITKELKCKESKVHTHTDDCFDSEGNWICGQLELVRHVHSKECFEYEDAERKRNFRRRYFAETEHVKVTAIVPEIANIPEEAEFRVTEITRDSDPDKFEEYLKQLYDMDEYTLSYLLDIGFYIGEDEIEPEDEVEIIVEDLLEEIPLDDIEVIHFVEDGDTEIIEDTEVKENGVSFQSDSFSTFAIVIKNADNSRYFGRIYQRNEFYNSKYYTNTSIGALGNFHLIGFSNSRAYVHIGGNILTADLECSAAIDNCDMYGNPTVTYAQHYHNYASGCGGQGSMLVVGSTNRLTVNAGQVIADCSHERYSFLDNVGQIAIDNDTSAAPYIDISELKKYAINLSNDIKNDFSKNENVAKQVQDSHTDGRILEYKVLSNSKPAVININIDDLNSERYFNISNINKDKSSVIVNVDCNSSTNSNELYINTPLYTSGVTLNDVTLSSRVIWNFYNSKGKSLHFEYSVVNGTVLAPEADVYIACQLNGSVICNRLDLSVAQSHFYPFGGDVPDKPDDKLKELKVKKEWKNMPDGDLSGYRVWISLYRTTNKANVGNIEKMSKVEPAYEYRIALSADNNWEYSFKNLPNNYYYCAFEESVIKDEQDVTHKFEQKLIKNSDDYFTIENTYSVNNVRLEATKLVEGQIPGDNQSFKFDIYKYDRSSGLWQLLETVANKNEKIIYDINVSDFTYDRPEWYWIEEQPITGNSIYERDISTFVYVVNKHYNSGRPFVELIKYNVHRPKTKFEQEHGFGNLASVSDLVENVTFNNTIQKTKIDVKKQWRNVAYIKKPIEIDLELFVAHSAEETRENWIDTGTKLTLKEDTYWVGSFENLPMYEPDGTKRYYYVEEIAMRDENGNSEMGVYETSYQNNSGIQEGLITVTNTHEKVETYTELTVKKNWYDTELKWTGNAPVNDIAFNLWRTKLSVERAATDKETRDVTITVAGNMDPYKLTCCNGDTVEYVTEFFYDYVILDERGDGKPEKFKEFLESMTFNYPTSISIDGETRKVTYRTAIPITEKTGKDISILSVNQSDDSKWYWDLKYMFSSYKIFVDDILCDGESVAIKSNFMEYYGWYQITKADEWKITIKNLPSMITENGVTTTYIYGVEEQVPEGATYELLGYFPDKKGSYENVSTGQFSICNMVNSTDIFVEKQWYSSEGERLSDSAATEVSINIQIYQTTSPTRPETNDNAVLVGEYILQKNTVSKVYQKYDNVTVSTVKAQGYDVIDEWKCKISKLPVCDENRNPYYYYAVESKIGEYVTEATLYDPDYGAGEEAITNKGTLVIKNYGTQVFDFLPSTGGKGTINYWIKKWFTDLISKFHF